MRRSVIPAILLSLGSVLQTSAYAQGAASDYPNRPIKLIVASSPGGIPDSFSRALAQHLSERLGQPVLVDNRPGASQAIGAEAAAKSPPDGYTLFLGTQSGLVMTPISRKKLPYDPVRDFTPISLLFTSPLYLVVHSSVPAKSVQELIALVRSRPGKMTYASLGIASPHHLAAETFKSRMKLDILHVPYKGIGPAIADLLAGHVDMVFGAGLIYLPHVKAGKLRMLATTALKRTEAMPDLPTMSESGLPGFEVASWFSLVAPAGVPRPIVERLNREVAEMLRSRTTRDKFADGGIEITPSTPEELGERIRSDLPLWTKILREAGIQAE